MNRRVGICNYCKRKNEKDAEAEVKTKQKYFKNKGCFVRSSLF
jgi:hypothetical protein